MSESVVRQARNGDVKINFEVRGPANRPALILVAGLGEQIGAVEFPDEHVERFAEEGFRVVRMDNRDAGLSTELDGRPDLDELFTALFSGEPAPVPYSFLDMADDVLAVAEAIDAPEFHLVGASMGGWIVRWATLRAARCVKSLTVVMSGAGADIGDDGPQLDTDGLSALIEMADHRAADNQIAYTVDLWRADWGPKFAFDEQWVRDQVTASFHRSYRPDGIYRQIVAGFASSGLWHAQEKINAPTLVMHGTEDEIFPIEHGESTAAQIPGAELWRVEGMGHAMASELWDEMVERVAHKAST